MNEDILMVGEGDPLETQRDGAAKSTVAAELGAASFEDIHEIGHGGFGVVYRCVQPALDRTVAVKVLTADLDEENRARFFREQRAMGRLSGHPNIVNVLEVGATTGGRPYIVMQYHPRGSLDTRISRHGPLPLAEALRIGVKTAGAVETAHHFDILHRDVKPANILLTDYGEPVLTDFGIAHISGGFETATGTVTGSPAYTAPEVLKGDPPSPASDVYGLGATLFSSLTGHAAFERHHGEQVIAQFLRITSQPIPNLREKGFPEDLCGVIERAMSADPNDRPSSAAQFGDELREVEARNGFPIEEMALLTDPDLVGRGQDRAGADSATGTRTRLHPPGPAAVVPSGRGNLPLELTTFIGRRHDLTEAKKMLSASRLVTLTGIGGVGKTRLALRVATDVRQRFTDGVWLVELGELRVESLLVDLVAAGLGLRHQSARPVEDVVVDFLTSRQLLLVLDNCEQVVDAVAGFAETLLRVCPELRILVTSREPLSIGGEMVLRVPPLSVPDPQYDPPLEGMPRYDAVTLFAERAAAAVPGFEITDTNRVAIAGICRQLDGLPLPIELAAARLRAMSAEQVLERLTNRYKLLTTGNRGAPTRQQTLRLCIAWSYDLCTPREQQLWSDLSAFAGSFELDAAEGICSRDLTPEDLLDSLASLVDKSILIREEQRGIVRFRLLETLREFGREKAQQAGDYCEQCRRHRDWYRQLALDAETDWISTRQLDWISRLEREQSNLREAMEFSLSDDSETNTDGALRIAAALFRFWLSRNLLVEGRHWLDRSLNKLPTRPTAERVKALYAESVLAEAQGDLAAGAALVEAGRVVTNAINDPVSDARITHAEGLLALYSGDLPRACTRLEAALEMFGTQVELFLETLMMLGLAYTLRGDTTRAIACHEKVLTITQSRGESVYRSYSLWAMGVAVFRQGDHGWAARLLEKCLRLTLLVDEPLVAAMCVETLAWISCHEQDPRRAVTLMSAAETLAAAAGSSPVLFPDLLIYHQECEEMANRKLGRRECNAARREGKAMDAQGAVTFALGEQPQATASSGRGATNLTSRERQVADLVAQGLTNKAIATKLVISQRTVQGHVEHVLAKLGFTSRAQIAAWVAAGQ